MLARKCPYFGVTFGFSSAIILIATSALSDDKLNLEGKAMKRFLSDVLAQKGGSVYSVSPDASALDAVHLMNEKGIGAVLVLVEGKTVGIFSERDVLRKVLDGGLDAAKTPVGEVMTRKVISMRSDKTVNEAMGVMTEKRCRHLPIIDDGTLVGVLSVGDLTKWVSQDQEHKIEELIDYIVGRYPG